MELGYAGAARVALSHSFHCKSTEGYIGKFDIPRQAQEELKVLLERMEYDDYDLLIQLSDSVAAAEGIVPLEERMNDVKRRYGSYPQEKWDRNVELRGYFEGKMGRDLYEVIL